MAPGFIHDELDLKVLVLYILDHSEGPMDFAELTGLALCDDGVDYFTFTEVVADLIRSEHLILTDGLYDITDKGRTNSQIMESSLPGVVRARCDRALREFNAALRRKTQITAQVVEKEGRFLVEMRLHDGAGPLMDLTLVAPSEETGKQVARRFLDDPEVVFSGVLALLTKDDKGGVQA